VTLTSGSADIGLSALGCTPSAVDYTRLDVLKTSHFTGNYTFIINAGDGRIAGSPITIILTSDDDSLLTKQVVVSDFGVAEIL
jgi:hypothetical protein